MRLICPECNALYDIADAMIPPEGREVECSACGHVWLQLPAAVAPASPARPAPTPAAPAAAGPSPAKTAPLRGLSGDLLAAAKPGADSLPDLGEAPVLQRPLPDDVLSILREETARELGARRATRETPPAPSAATAPDPAPAASPAATTPATAAKTAPVAMDLPAPDPAIEPVIVPAPDVALPTAPVVEDLSPDWPATTVTRPLLDNAVESPPLPAASPTVLPAAGPDLAAEAPAVAPPAPLAPVPMPAAAPTGSGDRPPVPRRRMPRGLPDVEQLAATIHTAQQLPTAQVPPATPAVTPPDGYRTGFLRALSVAAALLVAYVAGAAWVRSGQAPDTVVSLVAGVDGLRAGLQDVVAAIIGREVR